MAAEQGLNDPGTAALVTVIVPVYNGEAFLGEALDSILAQDHRPLQILVVDDGSSDRSAEVAAGRPGVELLRKPHSGLAATLNHGIGQARGEYLAFLDADDRWLPGKLTRQLDVLRRAPDIDLVFTHARRFSQAAVATASDSPEIHAPPQPAVCKSALLARRHAFETVGGFAEAADRHDFLDWYARAIAAGLRSHVLPEALAERRIHATNEGRRNPERQRHQYLSTLHAVLQQRRAAAERP